MWLDIDRKAEAVMLACDQRIRAAEQLRADQEASWDGFCGLVRVCDDEEFREKGIIRPIADVSDLSSFSHAADHQATAAACSSQWQVSADAADQLRLEQLLHDVLQEAEQQMYRVQARLSLPSQQCRVVHVLATVLLVEVVFVFLVVHGSKAQETTLDGSSVCRPRLEAADNPATTGNRQLHHFETTCRLEIQGHGRKTSGVKSIKLSCHNPSEPDAKILVGVSSATPSSPIVDVHGRGIQLVEGRKLPCQQAAAESPIAPNYETASLHGLLYFCQGNIRFVKPLVQDVWLPYDEGLGVQEERAIVVVAGTASAVFHEAVIERNDASSVIAVLGTGEVEIWDSIFNGNRGNSGSGVSIREDAVLRVKNSIFKDHFSSGDGGK
eukprot:gene7360-7571_t